MKYIHLRKLYIYVSKWKGALDDENNFFIWNNIWFLNNLFPNRSLVSCNGSS